MTTKHTPAPWHIGKAGYDKAVYDDKGANIAIVPDMLPDTEAQANANLIKAAPDMFEALEHIRRSLDFSTNGGKSRNRFECELLKIAEKAIAKARGES